MVLVSIHYYRICSNSSLETHCSCSFCKHAQLMNDMMMWGITSSYTVHPLVGGGGGGEGVTSIAEHYRRVQDPALQCLLMSADSSAYKCRFVSVF